jgi:hypothetical protein
MVAFCCQFRQGKFLYLPGSGTGLLECFMSWIFDRALDRTLERVKFRFPVCLKVFASIRQRDSWCIKIEQSKLEYLLYS